jgi:murein DD-endopeptidase MepM/ murein hydrolase activator NlpD
MLLLEQIYTTREAKLKHYLVLLKHTLSMAITNKTAFGLLKKQINDTIKLSAKRHKVLMGNKFSAWVIALVGIFLLYASPVFAVEIPPVFIEKTIVLKKNQTLANELVKASIPKKDAYAALHQLRKKYSLRSLPLGQEFTLLFKEPAANEEPVIESLSFYTKDDKIARVIYKDGDFEASVKKRPITVVQQSAVGTISDSLYASASKAGLPAALVPSFANLFAWELDFTRDIRKGDMFSVVYERIVDENGNFIRNGTILAAELTTRKKTHNAYQAIVAGKREYYDEKGLNKRRSLLRTPLEFSRISSHFNLKRKHPILGYTRAHKGTDFAAPTGTPVKAAGDGVIEMAKWHGGYGRYIRIRHDKKYKTGYAHLSRYARGIKTGKKVRQGQTIGYVGTSGRSTGPHLHYELMRYGTQVNAMREKLPNGKKIPQKHFNTFKQQIASYRSLLDSHTQLASNE